MTEYSALTISREKAVATVTLVGPGKGNAMGPDFWKEMPQAFAALDRDDDVRVVVVRGKGDNFSYGLDLKASAQVFAPLIGGENLVAERTRLHDMVLEWQEAFNCIVRCRKPVVAAVDGWCIGGGMNLLAACDIRVSTSDAKFSLREPQIAIVPDLGALQRLPSIIGEGATRLMAFTAGNFDAPWAERVGLVQQVYDDATAMEEGLTELCAQIVANAPHAVQGSKRVLEYSRDATTAAALEYVATWNSAFLQSKDLAEAFMAFAEGRKPSYQGE